MIIGAMSEERTVVLHSGQIRSRPKSTTDWTPQMVVNCKGNGTPAISGKSRLVKYYNLARYTP